MLRGFPYLHSYLLTLHSEPTHVKNHKKSAYLFRETVKIFTQFSLQSARRNGILNLAKGAWFFCGINSLKK